MAILNPDILNAFVEALAEAVVRKMEPLENKCPDPKCDCHEMRYAHTVKPAGDDQLLSVDETAALLHKTRRWVYRNAVKLGFGRRLGRRSLLCSRQGIERALQRGI